MKKLLIPAAAAALGACGSLPLADKPVDYQRLKVAVVEPASRPPHNVFEDLVQLYVNHFGSVVMAKSAEEAKATDADLYAELVYEDRLAKFLMCYPPASLSLRVKFSSRDGQVVDKVRAEGRQMCRPFLFAVEVNERASRRALSAFEAALRTSENLRAFAKAKTASPGAAFRKPVSAASDADKPGYRLPEDPRLFALVIGVETYPSLPAADYAERDAQAVRAHLLALGYPERNILYLSGSQAVKSAVEKYVESWLPAQVPEDGRVFVYFSGHGAPDPKTGQAFLVPWDGDPKFLANTGYPLPRLYAKLGSLKAKEIVVAMDSCFSGAGGRSVLPRGTRPLVTTLDQGAGAGGKLVVLAAAGGDEITGTEASQGHGLFTYFLLRGLNERKGAASVKALYDYLTPKVRDLARRDNRDQTPQLIGTNTDVLLGGSR